MDGRRIEPKRGRGSAAIDTLITINGGGRSTMEFNSII